MVEFRVGKCKFLSGYLRVIQCLGIKKLWVKSAKYLINHCDNYILKDVTRNHNLPTQSFERGIFYLI